MSSGRRRSEHSDLDNLCEKSGRAPCTREDAGAQGFELYRIAAWASAMGVFEHWDDEAGDYRFPDGWPEGVTAEGYVAKELGLATAAPAPEPAPADTTLHRMLGGAR